MIEAQILDFKILTSGRDTMKKFSVIILYTIIIVSCSRDYKIKEKLLGNGTMQEAVISLRSMLP